ncbi:hypothetical protein EK21DRAFT_58774 [Setomelanomma holmii]|uniref:Zn(2)-C6 fungal-type domain-containing protein n=1 Tax=Setomelanomma holmii TaxID=210430 RepID=A0A9P4HF46_9PLEO|nr:hypothetical protein EK21DRAFT_58774 [Setomelanomma holmii]
MGNYRSRSGCLTCRARRVKCDEARPVCKACSKKNRPCQWEAPQNKFKSYQPDDMSSKSATHETDSEAMDVDGSEEGEASRTISPKKHEARRNRRADSRSDEPSVTMSSPGLHSPGSPFLGQGSRSQSGGSVSVASLLRPQLPEGTRAFSKTPIALSHDEAVLVHHYTEHLGRWLDCTDATRQFTLGVPEKVKLCPVLCHAVLSFAARHRREDATAQAAYQRCIALLIDRLNEDTASHDETLLCAIVILRFYEQLSVPSTTGSDDEQHLAGTSAILRASQGHHYVDPSAPTLREAAFWVYVRQCLYNATINQQPPDIDFSLQLHPTPESMQDAHPLARLRLETAWANQMTWNLAHVVNYCFEGSEQHVERTHKGRRWLELWDQVQKWVNERPEGFNPIWQGEPGQNGPFPEVWFTTDWHVVSFGSYHFACILLLTYKPGPKFAIRNVSSLSATNLQILEHARIICGACKSSPETVPLSVTVCHTIFIWGPLVSDLKEREAVVQLLIDFEDNHLWPTTWIINALKKEWGTD